MQRERTWLGLGNDVANITFFPGQLHPTIGEPGSVFIDGVRQISRFLMYVRRKMDVFSKYESIEVHGKRFTSMVRRL